MSDRTRSALPDPIDDALRVLQDAGVDLPFDGRRMVAAAGSPEQVRADARNRELMRQALTAAGFRLPEPDEGGHVDVRAKKEDPLALRASIGGGKTAGDGNYYLVYRGDPEAVLKMLGTVLFAAAPALRLARRGPQG